MLLYAANCVDGGQTVSSGGRSFRVRMVCTHRNYGGAATPGAIKSLINHRGAMENLRNHAPDVAVANNEYRWKEDDLYQRKQKDYEEIHKVQEIPTKTA
jgi:hypothetical protein